jgi:hypothetical protein
MPGEELVHGARLHIQAAMSPITRALAHFLRCKDATQLMSQLQERPATVAERVKLRWHLAACGACALFEHQLGFLREAMRRYRT